MVDFIFANAIWQKQYFSNTLQQYVTALAVLIILVVIFKIFQSIILSKAKKFAQQTKTDIDDALVNIIHAVRPPFYVFLAFWLAIKMLSFPDYWDKFINGILIIWVVYLVIDAIQILIDFIAEKKLGKNESSIVQFIRLSSKIVVWSFGILLLLQNLGVNVTSLIAGLGIGGIAIALAVQNILGDLFSSFAIYFDKPFEVDDFIVVGQHSGTVKKIGVKTTRLQSVQGEEVVISNAELTSARIQNYKKMKNRLVIFSLLIAPTTTLKNLKLIPGLVKDSVSKVKDVKFVRTHLKEFTQFGFNFEIAYEVKSADYDKYLDVNQKILQKIRAALDDEKIELSRSREIIN